MRIQQAANTLIVWVPDDAHGTSLPMAGPYDEEPEFHQRGLAFVSSPRIVKAWEGFKSDQMSAGEAQKVAESGEDHEHHEIFE